MSIVAIRDLKEHAGETVTVQGWLYNRRSSKKIHFLLVRDGTGIVQGIVPKADVDEALFESAGQLAQECSLRVTGEVRLDERAPGGVELRASAFELVGGSADYPLGKQDHGADFLLTNRHLWLRSKRPTATLRIRDTIIRAIRDYLHGRGFINVDAPMFTPNACEGTSTLFEVEYMDEQKAYLTQSGQLYMEAAAMALGKVYCLGPAFRAEKSKTRKHLTEFWMLEPEMAYATLEDAMDLAEGTVAAIVSRVLEENRDDLDALERDVSKLEAIVPPFPRLRYEEAAKILADKTDFKFGDDLGAPDEDAIMEGYDKPLLITHWPHEVKAFYMKRDESDDRWALGVDMIAPEGYGEIVGGGERATDQAFLESQIDKHELPREAFDWYLDLRKYGSVPHAGYGLGLERVVSWVCGLQHVREAIPFPRTIYRIYP
ncbi:MAG: asparagine--tRNA ligase [Planctomycetota bacterium]